MIIGKVPSDNDAWDLSSLANDDFDAQERLSIPPAQPILFPFARNLLRFFFSMFSFLRLVLPVSDGFSEFPWCPSDKEKTCQIILILLNFYPISSKHTILLFCIALKKWDHNSNVIQKYFSQFRFHLRELECRSVSRLHLWFSVSTPCNPIIISWLWSDNEMVWWLMTPCMMMIW